MNLAPMSTTPPAASCPPPAPVPLEPLGPGLHMYTMVWDDPKDWRGDRYVVAKFEDGAFAVRGAAATDQARRAVEQLRVALLGLNPSTDPAATSLPPSWRRNPKVDAGSFGFGISHLTQDRRRIAYTDMAGTAAAASPATTRVLEALRQLGPLGHDWN